MSESQYFVQRDQKNEEKLKAMLSALPSCCTDFFRGIEPSTSSMTRLSYAYDLTMFFHFLKEIKEEWKEIPLEQLQTEALSQISVQDIERYLEDLKYRPNDPEHKNMNREQGIKRKFFSLKSFFGYFKTYFFCIVSLRSGSIEIFLARGSRCERNAVHVIDKLNVNLFVASEDRHAGTYSGSAYGTANSVTYSLSSFLFT